MHSKYSTDLAGQLLDAPVEVDPQVTPSLHQCHLQLVHVGQLPHVPHTLQMEDLGVTASPKLPVKQVEALGEGLHVLAPRRLVVSRRRGQRNRVEPLAELRAVGIAALWQRPCRHVLALEGLLEDDMFALFKHPETALLLREDPDHNDTVLSIRALDALQHLVLGCVCVVGYTEQVKYLQVDIVAC